jgi:hypothetical protein
MSAGQFAMALGAIAIATLAALYFGVRWIERPRPRADEPVEHGNGEP